MTSEKLKQMKGETNNMGTPYIVTTEKLRQFFRYEISAEQLAPSELTAEMWAKEKPYIFWPSREEEVARIYEPYYIQWEDILALIDSLKKKNPNLVDLCYGWGSYVLELLYDRNLRFYDETENEKIHLEFVETQCLPENLPDAMMYVLYSIANGAIKIRHIHPGYCCADCMDFDAIRNDVLKLENGCYGDIEPTIWTDDKKAEFLRKLNHVILDNRILSRQICVDDYIQPESQVYDLRRDDKLAELSQDEVNQARAIIDELSAKGGYSEADDALALSCAGGNRLHGCNWQFAYDKLLQRINEDMENNERDKCKCDYAVILEDICREGYLTHGKPDYDKAFHFYSIGAAGN